MDTDWRVSNRDWHEPPEWNYRGRQVDEQGDLVNAPRPTLRGEPQGVARRGASTPKAADKIPLQYVKQKSVRAYLIEARGACPLKGRGRGEWIMRHALLKMGYSERDVEAAARAGVDQGLKGQAQLGARARWLHQQRRVRG